MKKKSPKKKNLRQIIPLKVNLSVCVHSEHFPFHTILPHFLSNHSMIKRQRLSNKHVIRAIRIMWKM